MSAFRNTKIIATVGPACQSPEVLKRLIAEGVDVFRINASHSTAQTLKDWFERIRRASSESGRHIAVLVDLQGPRVRTGRLLHPPLKLEKDRRVTIQVATTNVPRAGLSTTCKEFVRMVKKGDAVLIDNGALELKVESVAKTRVGCRVIRGGLLGENKGINLPHAPVTLPALTTKDLEDLATANELGADYIALSFVRSRSDIVTIKNWMKKNGVKIPVIAKIEKPSAVRDIEPILSLADGVMVARGDLGIEMGVEKVPPVQKMLIAEAEKHRVPVITATQMLETMMAQAQPSRAEVSDIANAVFDGTDAVMLSGETSVGKYPAEAVRTMRQIIEEAERNRAARGAARPARAVDWVVQLRAIAQAALNAAREARARGIVIFTRSGRIAQELSKLKPPCGLLAATDSEKTLARLNLLRGVRPLFVEKSLNPQEMILRTDLQIMRGGILNKGDIVIVVSGPWVLPGSLFMLAIHRVGEVYPNT